MLGREPAGRGSWSEAGPLAGLRLSVASAEGTGVQLSPGAGTGDSLRDSKQVATLLERISGPPQPAGEVSGDRLFSTYHGVSLLCLHQGPAPWRSWKERGTIRRQITLECVQGGGQGLLGLAQLPTLAALSSRQLELGDPSCGQTKARQSPGSGPTPGRSNSAAVWSQVSGHIRCQPLFTPCSCCDNHVLATCLSDLSTQQARPRTPAC